MLHNKYTNLLSMILVFSLLLTSVLVYRPDTEKTDPTETPQHTEAIPLLPAPSVAVYDKFILAFTSANLQPPAEETEPAESTPVETQPEVTKPVHQHNFLTTVVKPTPAYRGYTEHSCECGETYRDNYTKPTLSAVSGVKYDLKDVPAEMLNSDILQALAYLGVNVQRLKDDGLLYRIGYIGSKTPSYARSPVPYSRNGNGSGQQTIADSSTPTGLAPDVTAFKKTGLDCVDLAAYYLTNYLPNVKGADISALEAMHDKYSGYFGRCYDHMDFWPKACADLAEQGLIEAYTYEVGEDYTDVFSKISPGTLIQMGNKKDATRHYAIYAGSFNGNHYIIHSGNPERGPEISLITYLWSSPITSSDSWPVAFYEFHFPIS